METCRSSERAWLLLSWFSLSERSNVTNVAMSRLPVEAHFLAQLSGPPGSAHAVKYACQKYGHGYVPISFSLGLVSHRSRTSPSFRSGTSS
jgi:hypothetical protein